MTNELENPFSVTKATEFSDVEINDYWVNFNTKENVSIISILNPNEFLPKYLIGGKGCGKTHILRYFSFPLQKIRHNNNINDLLIKDKYIGFYSIFHGLNSSRFSGKDIEEEEWNSVFQYYFELYICDNLLHTIKDIFYDINLEVSEESKLIYNILSIFNNYKEIVGIVSISDLIDFLTGLRRKIDSQVLNAAFTRTLDYNDVKVLFSPGDLLFGIPNSISNSITQFSEVKFIYIFDEYEKLYEWQKIFVNTLIWDKKTPVTFWVGARRYGYTTRKTKSGQEMKAGSEFHPVDLDVIIRSNEELYKQFAVELYSNRLRKFYESKGLNIKPLEVERNFQERFEPYDENKIINDILNKKKKTEYKHLKEFRKKLLTGIKTGYALDLKDESEINNAVEKIVFYTDDNPLYQKYKLFYLYRLWYNATKKEKFFELLQIVNSEFGKFVSKQKSAYDEIVDKRKKDLIAQLTKENDVKNTEYSGINEFIKISQGNVRSFILILKKAVEFAKIKGEKPLEAGGMISLDSQYLAVFDTARWFYEDAEVIGEDGKRMYNALRRLTDYFILERFCDKPVETTISCFYLKTEKLSINSLKCIDLMKMHSIIIEDTEGRAEKNSGRKERLFLINKVLAPLWNLPTVVRGSLSFNSELAESIFDFDFSSKFEGIYKIRKSQLNAPDFGKQTNETNETLF